MRGDSKAMTTQTTPEQYEAGLKRCRKEYDDLKENIRLLTVRMDAMAHAIKILEECDG